MSAKGVGPVSVRPVAPAGGSTAPTSLQVSVLGHAAATAAGVNGVLFSLTPRGTGRGSAQVTVDYRSFAQAYGGGFGSRLSLVELPACVLTHPQLTQCQTEQRLASVNDASHQTLTARVPVVGAATAGTTANSASRAAVRSAAMAQPMVLAAVSGTTAGDGGGPSGSYGATTLKPSGSWSAGGSSGSFSYSYPMSVPSAPSSLVPQLSLDYDSGSVDGQTSATQAQASWAGDGWSSPQSYIEQTFAACADSPEGTASPSATQDECWDGEILTLSLGGSTTSLVYDSAKGTFTTADDSGDVITHVTGSNNGSKTHNTDYWTVTERDGSVFEFGRNELPGWASGKATTNSVDYTQVYSAHSGDPCYSSSGFSASGCLTAYRWNLDYVKDVHGDAMAYYYDQSTNSYGKDNTTTPVSYIRDSYLDHVDYGFADGNAYGTVPDKVTFATGDRCVLGTSSCDPLNSTTKANWPDVPFDLVCSSTTTCPDHAPSYFSTVRLTSIATEQYSVAQAKYLPVDSWALDQTMPVTGDGNATLWLQSITHTGSDAQGGGSSTPIAMPSVTFGAVDLPNRVDTVTDGLPPLYRFRINSITNESGSVTGVDYELTSPCTGPVTLTASANTSSCYPVYWTPQGYSAPFLDWFNKYAVQEVTETDPTGGAPVMATSYQYANPAWHFDDNEVVKAKYRTYGQWRGYGDVKTFTGDGVNDPRTESEAHYYQGMSDDNNSTTVNVTDSQGGVHQDLDELAGNELESTSYLGSGGPVDHSTITSYWVSPAVATRTRTGLPDLTANLVEPVETWSRQAITDTGSTTWRINESDTSYDATVTDADFGMATEAYDHTVPVIAADDRCTSGTYALPNTTLNLVGLQSGTEIDAVACGGFTEGAVTSVPGSVNTLTAPTTVSRPNQVISAVRVLYDDPTDAKTWPQPTLTFPQTTAPSTGATSITQTATGYSGGTFTWQTSKTQLFDAEGRATDTYDSAGADTKSGYVTNSLGLVTGSSQVNALGQATSETLDPARGVALTSTDANGVVTTSQYDTLGRITSLWKDSRATTSPANEVYTYLVSDTGVTATTTQTLNDEAGYTVSTVIYDAMMRPRQTQTSTPQGGRLVTDTFYDTRGWKSATYNGWWDSTTGPNTTLVSAANLKDEVPNQDYYTYDGLGRVVVDSSEKDNVVVSTTTTVYNGDRTTVIPPSGGTVASTLTDAMGRTSELDDYSTAPTLNTPANTFTGIWTVSGGTSVPTTYGYDTRGNQNSESTDGSTWTTTYNLLGQATAKSDPDAGASTLAYDVVGNLVQTTDSRGRTISYTYDALGRKTAEYDAASTAQSSANEIASWVYDNSNNAVTGMTDPIGQTTTTTAYSDGAAYVTQSLGFNTFGESKGETVTIPSTEGALAGSYTFQDAYTTNTGLPDAQRLPAAGGLPLETLTDTYTTALDLPNGMAGTSPYAQSTAYDAYGRVNQETLGSIGSEAYLTDTYDPHTGKLTDQLVTGETATPTDIDNEAYSYDLDGNITAQTETRAGSSASSETQCYQYDGLDHLTQAWTATDSCAATPTPGNSATVGDGIASGAYWTSWTYDALGNRQSETDYATTGGTATTTNDSYNGAGGSVNQPHTLTSTSTTGAGTGSTAYGYDPAGNMTSRTTPSTGSQTLNWNDAGQLTGITGGTAGDSDFVHNADGSVLLEKDPGTSTLYLPGEQLALNTGTGSGAGTVIGTRYYALPGGGTAVRTGYSATNSSSNAFEITDQHGTSDLMLDTTAQVPTWRQFTPFGAPRGTTTTWLDNRGFLNDPNDTSTGLTLIGAREYDPTTGRFISLDPLFEATSLQELNGYSYAGSNPVTYSDPSGTRVEGDGGCNGTGAEVDACEAALEGSSGGGGSGGCVYVLVNPCGSNPNPGLSEPRAYAPTVHNTKLRKILDGIYARPGTADGSLLGDGKLGTAVINEFNTGLPTGGKWHIGKAAAQMNALATLLEQDRKQEAKTGEGLLSPSDRSIAQQELSELWSALNSVDENGAATQAVNANPEIAKQIRAARTVVLAAPSASEVTGQKFEMQGDRAPRPVAVGEAENMRGFLGAFGVAGDVLAIAQWGINVHQQGWWQGTKSTVISVVDPFGVTPAGGEPTSNPPGYSPDDCVPGYNYCS
ncbi:RHS repeat-associated core domain-containing protein [Streptacidiphilus sp. P02-A3a]|uniref:RHS repeat domain-containing protein n=1 Tax=Streptacidiphilus sp. P02-A3a TaxID=2704468 RepID=UPI0015FABB41|nr:RHS repeat-associated core domain-containing protein [Streptacidiphilus sp. P02-A3a]QMU72437.1 RHS repeat-associated core domain-containing protein [Streptacidiphilus sp. P02-A3a]